MPVGIWVPYGPVYDWYRFKIVLPYLVISLHDVFMVPCCNYLRHLPWLVDFLRPFSYWLNRFFLCSHWSVIVGRKLVPNQCHDHWYRDSQARGPALPRAFPSTWLLLVGLFTPSPAPIGQLLQVALEHARVCLINATATGTEILKALVLSDLCFFPLLPSYWLDNIYPWSHWSIIVGCPGARQRVPNQRHSHRYRDSQVPGPSRPWVLHHSRRKQGIFHPISLANNFFNFYSVLDPNLNEVRRLEMDLFPIWSLN